MMGMAWEVPVQRLVFLDFLRFVAALMVVAFHYTHASGLMFSQFRTAGMDTFTRYGYLGVHLFFMISGFVIFYSVQHSRHFWDFLVKRFFRLWPSLVLAACITFGVTHLFSFPLARSVSTLVCNLTVPLVLCKAGNLGYIDEAYWSLAVEFTFYVLVAGLVLTRIHHHEGKLKFFLVLWLVVAALPLVTGLQNNLYKLFMDVVVIHGYAAYFVMGICLYKIWEGHSRSRSHHLILLAALVLSLVQAYNQAVDYSIDRRVFYDPILVVSLVSLFGITLFLYAHRLFEWQGRIFVQLGLLTYPLYLIHQNVGYVVMQQVQAFSGNMALMVGAASLVAVLLSLLMLFTSEKASQHWRRWYGQRQKKKPGQDVGISTSER